MDDADIGDISDFRAAEEPPASSVSEYSGGRRAESGGQPYRDDVTGAVLDSELAAAARAVEIRFVEFWHVWGVRPISECFARAGKKPIRGRWVDHAKGDATTP
eukprot:11314351-Alexandrium_andersonii.AAC.1